MFKRVQETIHKHSLMIDDIRIVVGVSGGPDSMTLLDILYRLSKRHRYTLIVAHVHYGIRGTDAQRDRDLVKKTAQKHGLIFIEKDLSKERHPSDEAWLRNVRYDFFEEARTQYSAQLIAVGHTRDDLVETFFLHLLRGSGLAGLQSFSYRRGSIIRPLLDIPRSDIIAYCTRHTLEHEHDTTNDDTAYLRNRIRHDLLPLLTQHYNPQTPQMIAQLTQTLSDDYAALTYCASSQPLQHTQRSAAITFSAREFLALMTSFQRMYLRQFCTQLLPQTTPIITLSFRTTQEIRKLIASTKNKTQTMQTNSLLIKKNGDTVSIALCT